MSRTPRLAPVRRATLRRACSPWPSSRCVAPRPTDDAGTVVTSRATRGARAAAARRNGEDVESADDAAWVVDATVDDVEEGTTVTLVAKTDEGEWETVSEGETDEDGRSR